MLSCFSHVQLFATPWTVAHWAPQSMGFSRQKYWSGLPWPSGDLPDLGIKPASLMFPALAGKFSTTSTTWEALCVCVCVWSVKVLVTQSCPTLCNPVDCSLPGFSVYGILQVVLRVGWMEHLTSSCVPGLGHSPGHSLQLLKDRDKGKNTGVGYYSLPNPGIKPRSPAMPGVSLPWN